MLVPKLQWRTLIYDSNICLVRDCFIQYTYPRAGAVKGDSIEEKFNWICTEQIFKSSFSAMKFQFLHFLCDSKLSNPIITIYKNFVWFNQEFIQIKPFIKKYKKRFAFCLITILFFILKCFPPGKCWSFVMKCAI